MSRFSRFTATVGLLAVGLALLVGPAGAQFGKNKVQYREFDWQIYHATHFDVYYYSAEEDQLENVVSLAESAYDRLSRGFDFRIQDPIPLIFYDTHAAFEQNNIILGFIPEAVGAFASPVRYRMVLPVDLPQPELYQLILHELTHIFQYHILFQGKLGRGLVMNPPQWLMEGMASYYAKDESASDQMYLRDAVVNDIIPSIAQRGVGGFFAYRFGHAAFDFMEERWGKEGVLDFMFEYRSTIGGRVDRALEQAFRIDAEDFDAEFRRWLRKRYLPRLVETGEPSDFGRPFRSAASEALASTNHSSPAVSPSGDLVVALGVPEGELDVLLLETPERRPLKNLTKGRSSDYQYITGQHLTAGRRMGRDIAFSPDGNQVAVFAKREKGRSLLLIDVLNGGIDRIVDVDVGQPLAPAWHPDGQRIAFSGTWGGQFDIFEIELATGNLRKLTDDEPYDGAPTYTPSGDAIVYSSVVGEVAKLFRVPTDGSGEAERLTHGDANDVDAVFSADGTTIFFTSDRNGYDNIYGLDLESGDVQRYTNSVTGCFMPAPIERPDGDHQLLYTGYWKGSFGLYRIDLDDPIEEPELVERGTDEITEPPAFEPDILVTLDDDNKDRYRGRKLFLEDANVSVGVTGDQFLVSRSYITFSDQLGDRRLIAALNSVESFSDFNITYLNLSKRLQWGAELFDDRYFFLYQTGPSNRPPGEEFDLERESVLRQTGVRGFAIFPLDFNHRVEGSAAFIYRDYDYPFQIVDDGVVVDVVEARTDEYPEIGLSFVGDTTVYDQSGPVSGRRYRLSSSYAPDLSDGGTLTSSFTLDFRQYVPVSRRTGLALRLFGGASFGNFPNIYSFGGLDTLRGVRFRTLNGDRAFYLNLEYRFPLLDALISPLPLFRFQGIRGRIFLDVGGAWFDYLGEEFEFWNSDENRLEDALSAYGWGLTIRFLGLDLHWDFARQWDFDTSEGGLKTEFWIGARF